MNCEQEENDLPQSVKDAGPPPHLDPDNAFLESWRALEDIFTGRIDLAAGSTNRDEQQQLVLPKVESIGISNFDLADCQKLMKQARVPPHILQGNVWTYLFDPHLMNYLKEHHIHFQAYNVMNGILGNKDKFPRALSTLDFVARQLRERSNDNDKTTLFFTHAQIILKWLTQNQVSVIPRTTSVRHLKENSGMSIATRIPDLEEEEQTLVDAAVRVLLKGRADLEQPKVTFVNQHSEVPVHIYWLSLSSPNSNNKEEVLIKENLVPSESFETMSYPGHTFVVYDDSKAFREEFTVQVQYGQQENIDVDLLSDVEEL